MCIHCLGHFFQNCLGYAYILGSHMNFGIGFAILGLGEVVGISIRMASDL
jgi:hypothetical protein